MIHVYRAIFYIYGYICGVLWPQLPYKFLKRKRAPACSTTPGTEEASGPSFRSQEQCDVIVFVEGDLWQSKIIKYLIDFLGESNKNSKPL